MIGVRVGAPPVLDEADHFMKCEACGQMFDMRDPAQVMHHIDDDHEPVKHN